VCTRKGYILSIQCHTMQNEIHREKDLTGQPCFMIPAFAIAIVSKEPPRAAKCSSPTVVMTAAASPELDMIFVASRAPPNPACRI